MKSTDGERLAEVHSRVLLHTYVHVSIVYGVRGMYSTAL